jgi:hypothetical protein
VLYSETRRSSVNIVAYLLKASTVEPEKQPLLGNARTQQWENCRNQDVTYTAVNMERLRKHVSAITSQRPTMEVLLRDDIFFWVHPGAT